MGCVLLHPFGPHAVARPRSHASLRRSFRGKVRSQLYQRAGIEGPVLPKGSPPSARHYEFEDCGRHRAHTHGHGGRFHRAFLDRGVQVTGMLRLFGKRIAGSGVYSSASFWGFASHEGYALSKPIHVQLVGFTQRWQRVNISPTSNR